MKTCSKCKEQKPLDEFYRNRRTKDGKASWCKECHRARSREYGRTHREEVNRNVAIWRSRHPERTKQQAREASRRYYYKKTGREVPENATEEA